MEKNLQQDEALQKFTKLVNDINVCMFITGSLSPGNGTTRPMATVEVEKDGTLWFYTDLRSIKVEEVAQNKQVHLAYAHPGKDSYLDVCGNATVVTDRQLIKDKWSPVVKAFFPAGADDPNLALLRVTPTECYYWDAESGKMVQFMKMAASIVTGARLADGAKGKLDI